MYRVLCLPSLPLANLAFGLLSLVKAMCVHDVDHDDNEEDDHDNEDDDGDNDVIPLSRQCVPREQAMPACHSQPFARYDLNLYPLLSHLPPSLPLIQTSSSILLSVLPSLLATALFRISVFALMFTFLDYWALIPLLLLWLANLVIIALLGKPSPRVAPASQQNTPAIGWRDEVLRSDHREEEERLGCE